MCKKENSYKLVYVWLQSPELAVARVASRVRSGGHSIPIETILRRYFAGLRNFFQIFCPITDNWIVFDNSDITPIIVAEKQPESEIMIYEKVTWNKILEVSKCQ
ncbi:MAG: hypothetical protein JNL74_02540 [Fibrobacteres bacterium]|nr:hypothetical protein [Fibrobacterota bacterium]